MIILTNGDVLELSVTFQHRGEAFSGARVYGAIGKKGITFAEVQGMIDEYLVTGIVDDVDWTDYTVVLEIPIANIGSIGGAVPGADYEVYVKLINIPGADIYWYGPLNDITLEEPVGAAEFESLTVTYQKKV